MKSVAPRILFDAVVLGWLSVCGLPNAACQEPSVGLAVDRGQIEAWIRDLAEGDPGQQRQAAFQLGRRGADAASAVEALLAATGSEQAAVRRYAADALGRLGTPAQSVAVKLAERTVRLGEDRPFQIVAAKALGRLGARDDAVLGALDQLMMQDDTLLRVAAAVSRSQLAPTRRATDVLQQTAALSDEPAAFEAVLALGEMQLEKTAGISSLLVDLLASSSKDVQRAAADVLARRQKPPIEDVIVVIEQWPSAVKPGMHILGEYAARQRETVLHADVPQQQFLIVSQRILKEIVPTLLKRLSDRRADVRDAAAFNLAKVGLLAVPALLTFPQDSADAKEAVSKSLRWLESSLPENWGESPWIDRVRRGPLLEKLNIALDSTSSHRPALFRLLASLHYNTDDLNGQLVRQIEAGTRDLDPQVRRYARQISQQLNAASPKLDSSRTTDSESKRN